VLTGQRPQEPGSAGTRLGSAALSVGRGALREGCKVQVPDADGQGESLSAARPAPAGLAGSGRGDQRTGGLRRSNRTAADSVPATALARPAFAAVIAGPAPRGQVVLPRVGLQFPRQLPFEAWLGVGAQLAAVAGSSAWCLGDWLIYGQAAYGGRYRDAIERTGLDYQTLRNYAWVAGRFELSRRRDTLSFGHHAEVAALPGPEQDFWLRKAEEFRWSTMRLRQQVRASLAERRLGSPGLEPGGPATRSPHSQCEGRNVTVRVTLTPRQLESCERAARSQGITLHAWAAQALEQAAQASPAAHPAHGSVRPR
jgi:hypothetical protein